MKHNVLLHCNLVFFLPLGSELIEANTSRFLFRFSAVVITFKVGIAETVVTQGDQLAPIWTQLIFFMERTQSTRTKHIIYIYLVVSGTVRFAYYLVHIRPNTPDRTWKSARDFAENMQKGLWAKVREYLFYIFSRM